MGRAADGERADLAPRQGIDDRGVLSKCNAVLSGYLGSENKGGHVIDVVKRVKAANPAALYVCDR